MALGSVATTTATLDTAYPGPPLPNTTGGSDSNNAGGSNGLYLYTFLITLLVLLSIASLIIVRSCLLRRRFRRQMQIAIEGGGGFVLSPHLRVPGSREGGIPIVLAGRRGRRREKTAFGEKPVMWEVWMEKHEDDEAGEESDDKWLRSPLVQPISTAVVRPTLPDPANARSTTSSSTPSPFLLTRETAREYFGIDMRSFREVVHDNWRNTRTNLQSLGRTLTPRPSSVVVPSPQRSRPVSQRMNSISGSPNRQSGIVTPLEDEDAEKRLTMGFLIAMPDARRPTYHSTQLGDHPAAFQVDLQQGSPTSDSFPYSPEELERGKMKALEIAGGDGEGDSFVGQFGIDDGELPPMVFGIKDVDWTGQKMPSTMISQARSGGIHT